MQSKTSYFNKTLFSKNLKRYWPLWGVVTFLAMLIPLILLIQVIDDPEYAYDSIMACETFYEILVSGVPAISAGYALLCAMAVYNYLYSTKSIGFFHSLPIKREGIFATNFISGMVMMLIPYLFAGTALTIELGLLGGWNLKAAGITAISVIGESLFFFSFATLTAYLVGNIIALPIVYLAFNFVSVLIEYLLSVLTGEFLFGMSQAFDVKAEFLSPLVMLYSKVYTNTKAEEVYVPGFRGGYSTWKTVFCELVGGKVILGYAIAGIAIAVIAFYVYKIRKSEKTGEMIVFGPVKSIIHFLATIVTAFAGGMIFYELINSANSNSKIRLTVCIVVAGIIAYFAAIMFIERTIKVFDKKRIIGCGCYTLFFVLVCIAIMGDWFGIEKRIPKHDEISSVYISADGCSFELVAGKDDELIDELLNAHREVVENKDIILELEDRLYNSYGKEDFYSTYFRLDYALKNGKTISRYYYVAGEKGDESSYMSALRTFFSEPELIVKLLHLDDEYTPYSGWVESDLYEADGNSDSYNSMWIEGPELDEIVKALEEDARLGYWKPLSHIDYWVSGENYIVINIDYEEKTDTRYGYRAVTESVYAHVNGDMVNTINVLEKYEIIDANGARKAREIHFEYY